MNLMREGKKPDDVGLVNQYGQSRKVLQFPTLSIERRLLMQAAAAHLCVRTG